jgi:hypothetical protein
MSTTALTQSNNQNLMKWEVVGGNKKSKKQVNGDANERSPSYRQFKLLNQPKIPKVEPMRMYLKMSILFWGLLT